MRAKTCHLGGTWGTQASVNFERARRWSFWLAVIVGQVASALTVAEASAQTTERVVLDYQSPAGCGTREQVLARLHALREGAHEPASPVDAVIAVKRTNGGYDVSFRAHKDAGHSQRELVVADCAAVIEASALLLHFTLDPELAALAGSDLGAVPVTSPDTPTENPTTGAQNPNVSPTTDTPAEPPEAKSLQAEAPAPAPSRSVSIEGVEPKLPPAEGSDDASDSATSEALASRYWLGIGPSIVSGIAPRVSFGPALEGGIDLGRWSVQLQASFHPVPSVPLENVPQGRLDTSLVRAHVLAGPAWGSSVIRGGPIVGVGVEHLSARPQGTSNPQSGSSTWWSAVGGANLQAQLAGGLGLDLRLGALMSLERPQFTVEGLPGLAHQPSRFGWCGSLGVVWMWNTTP